MNILFYKWKSIVEKNIISVMEKDGNKVYEYEKQISDYHTDLKFSMELIGILVKGKIEMVFSCDYFPILSMICETRNIPYVSWIYDCPLYTLYSKTVSNLCNYIFCFDEIYTNYIIKMGAKNCWHMPLATECSMVDIAKELNGQQKYLDVKKQYSYHSDISFVGNLYSEEKNRLYHIWEKLPEYERGYIDGVIASQINVYGYNFVEEVLPLKMVQRIVESCQLRLGDMYVQTEKELAADAVAMEISRRERIEVLELLSCEYKIDIYSGSKAPTLWKNNRNINWLGMADYEKQMPLIFEGSKININITSKSIQSGIPQRVLDILGCGGFCISNYQPELAEHFIDGKEIVLYTSMNDLKEKVHYYLEHEEEREKIAATGHEKVKCDFTYEKRWKEIRSLAYL